MKFTVPQENEGERLGNFLRKQGFSSRIIRQIKYVQDGFLVNGQYSYTNRILHEGDMVEITLPQTTTTVEAEDIYLNIVYENEYAMVVNKPVGIVVHPTRKYPTGTLGNGYIHLMQARGECAPVYRPVMRIDRNTSGLIVLAKSSFAASFYAKGIQKTYLALLQGKLERQAGSITTPIGLEENSFIKRKICEDRGKESRTDYEVVVRGKGYTLVKVYPKTGRTHQIRVHFSSIGYPLMGDDLYGGGTEEINRHALHCHSITLVHPFTKEVISVSVPPPADMEKIIAEVNMAYSE